MLLRTSLNQHCFIQSSLRWTCIRCRTKLMFHDAVTWCVCEPQTPPLAVRSRVTDATKTRSRSSLTTLSVLRWSRKKFESCKREKKNSGRTTQHHSRCCSCCCCCCCYTIYFGYTAVGDAHILFLYILSAWREPIIRLDAWALSVIATATWLGGWLGVRHTPVLYQNG